MKVTIIVRKKTGAATREGIATPAGTKLHAETARVLVLKVPGHSYLPGGGPMSYEVYEILRETVAVEPGARRLETRRLVEFGR